MNFLAIPSAANDQHIACPRCAGAMDHVGTKAIAGRDLKMFECKACDYVQVMSRNPRTETMEFVLSGAKPER
jgi:hypothetical protein